MLQLEQCTKCNAGYKQHAVVDICHDGYTDIAELCCWSLAVADDILKRWQLPLQQLRSLAAQSKDFSEWTW